jgi:N-acetylglutamate synthase-like GNAT family acetyltransferase
MEKGNHGLLIRNVRLEEIKEVSALLGEAYQQYENLIRPEAWKHYQEDIVDVCSRLDESDLIVAERDGRLVGCVTLYLDAERAMPGVWLADSAVIRLLAVHPAYRNRGIGRALMEECISRCRQANIKVIGLHTTEIMDIARQMYERMGFARVPESDFHPAPNVTVMAYRLKV